MSFQAYLDAVEAKTGKTPGALVDEAVARGYDDASDTLWLDGVATKPQ